MTHHAIFHVCSGRYSRAERNRALVQMDVRSNTQNSSDFPTCWVLGSPVHKGESTHVSAESMWKPWNELSQWQIICTWIWLFYWSFHSRIHLLGNLHVTLDLRTEATETLSRKILDWGWTTTKAHSVRGRKAMLSATKAQERPVSLMLGRWGKINTLIEAHLIWLCFALLCLT